MKWIDRRRIFAPPESAKWMVSHASVPTVRMLGDDRVRVFYSGRDAAQRSLVGWFDFDPVRPDRILGTCAGPVLEPGPPGSFDESGVMASWVVDEGSETRLYYIGWTRGVTVPFYNAIGLALSHDGGETFERISEGPIVGRDRIDPYFTASSCVLREDDAWRMWYLSCVGWEMIDGAPRHRYLIRHATSIDGVEWQRDGRACIGHQGPDEYAIARPSVIRDGEVYRMWYAYRGDRYRIGYAESPDGISWTRRDEEGGLEPSEEGWDSGMVAYACVFDHGGQRYMLYNGDGYGRTGIGIARLQPD